MKNLFIFYLIIFFIFFVKLVNSHMYEVEGIEILHPWATETDSEGNAFAYITITNNTKDIIYLKKIETNISKMHMFISNDNSVKSISIPANSIRSIDDFSIMFHGIDTHLKEGSAFPAKLIFSSGVDINIKFVVGETTSLDDAEKKMEHKHHH